MAVDDSGLALLAQRVAGDEGAEHVGRGPAGREGVQPVRPVAHVRERLRRDRPDVGARPRNHRADGEELRLGGDPEVAGGRVAARRSNRSRADTSAEIVAATGGDPDHRCDASSTDSPVALSTVAPVDCAHHGHLERA